MLLKTFVSILVINGVLASGEKFFRRDYTYNAEYDAFYKLHWDDKSSTWEEAFLTCDDEGGKLFYPKYTEEWTVAANLSDSLVDVDNIFVGVRDEFGAGDFVSIEGRLIPEFSNYVTSTNRDEESKCVVMSVRTGSYNVGSCKHRRPFVCKKIDNESCPTIDSAYVYSKATNKCYKINERPKTWQDAYHTCLMEGGILSTLIENIESGLLSKFVQKNQYYFIGVRRILPGDSFYSVQGAKIGLSEGERRQDEDCKVIIRLAQSSNNYDDDNNMKHIDTSSFNCNLTLPFICEMKVKV